MATFKLHYISRTEMLKEVDLDFLLQLLKPHKKYFTDRGLSLLVDEDDEFDYALLSSILMSPGDKIPPELVDDLFFIDEMSTQATMDQLLESIDSLPPKDIKAFRLPDGATAADVAVRVRKVNPGFLERVHAEHYSRNLPQSRRSYRYFVSNNGSDIKKFKRPKDVVIEQLEDAINQTLVKMKRGATAKVFIFERDDGVWFLVRHGLTCKREGTISADGSSSVYYRPEIYDILKYDAAMGEISINAETEKLYNVYREEFGRYFFGAHDFFPEDGKFTLDPLKEMGEDSITCDNVDGIDYVRLKEVQFLWGQEMEIRRSNDLFSTSSRWKTGLPQKPRIRQASFTVKFSNIKTERTVKIQPSNRASYLKDPNAAHVESWLKARGFILERETVDE